MTRFASVVLDADSTLAGIEGIDWLAERRGGSVAREVEALTGEAMAGAIPLETVYARRLELIAPTRAEVEALGHAYLAAVAPGAGEALARLRAAGVRVAVVSGGLLPALLPLTRALGVDDDLVRAVEIEFGRDGRFAAVRSSPLTTQRGKEEVVRSLALPRPVLAVGDGATDLAMRPAVDAFAAYVGFVRREAVAAAADLEMGGFGALVEVVEGG